MALSRTILQGLLILKEKLLWPVMKLMVITTGSEVGRRKCWGDKAAPPNVLWMPIWKLSHTSLQSAVQVKVILNGINLYNNATNGNSLNF